MNQLIICRFAGPGLGAEGGRLLTLTEFVPPKTRGAGWHSWRSWSWQGSRSPRLSVIDHSSLGLAADVHHRRIGSLVVWYLRRIFPNLRAGSIERPHREAEALMQSIQKDVTSSGGALRQRLRLRRLAAHRIGHAAAADFAAYDRRQLGADHDQHANLRLRDLPAAVFPAPGSHHRQLASLHAGAVDRVAAWLCARRLFVRFDRAALEHY